MEVPNSSSQIGPAAFLFLVCSPLTTNQAADRFAVLDMGSRLLLLKSTCAPAGKVAGRMLQPPECVARAPSRC